MTHHPARTSARYGGRPLPRPDDEIQDQGLGFDVGTLLGRRRMLQVLGLGAVTLGVAACAPATTAAATGAITEIPDETAGPYPGDGSNGADVLTESGIVRSDIRSSFGTGSATAEGVPMTIELSITDIAGGDIPFEGVAVYVWHCDRDGAYSLYSTGLEDENYLRGVQIADATGIVRFTSVFPACYPGRWPHVHFEVYPDEASITDATNAIATSQLALPEDVCDTVFARAGYEASVTNLAGVTPASDNVFSDDSAATQLATASGDPTTGYAVSLVVGVDTTTTPSVSGGGGGGGGTPPSGGGGPGGGGTPPSGAPPN